MKYRQLTKEQLESLHQEFAKFLAVQEIDVNEWNAIKETNPKLVQAEINTFSDIVWEDVLNKTEFIDHYSDKILNLFKCGEHKIIRIVVKSIVNKNFSNPEDLEWIMNNLHSSSIEVLFGSKSYSKNRNEELFEIIESGGEISDGKLYNFVSELLNSKDN